MTNTVTLDRVEVLTHLLNLETDWALIVATLGHSGFAGSLLHRDDKWAAYCMCDGFGSMTPDQLLKLNDGWDWSHIRDSSQDALTQVAIFVKGRIGDALKEARRVRHGYTVSR